MEVIIVKLSPYQREDCDELITLEELAHSLSQMAHEKALGLDGFPCEFYKACQEFGSLDLYNVYLKALKYGTL